MTRSFRDECIHLFNGLTNNALTTCNTNLCIDMAIQHVKTNCGLTTLPGDLAWTVVRIAIITWINTNILNQLPLEVDTTIEENATNASNLSILSSIIEGDVTYQFDNSLAKNSQITLKTYRDIANSIITTYQAYVDVELERHRKLRW
jgi:DNA-binding transcriptional regulator WhiA